MGICIDDQKPPSPVRSCYPHFDNVTGPTDKCPVCYLEFRREDLERHTQLCCEKTYRVRPEILSVVDAAPLITLQLCRLKIEELYSLNFRLTNYLDKSSSSTYKNLLFNLVSFI